MMYYHAFGLHIQSEFSLACLPGKKAEADATIRLGKIEEGIPDKETGGAKDGPGIDARPIQIEGVGRFLVRDGREIVADPVIPADSPILALALTEMILPVLLMQRGLWVFHAAAVEVENEAVAIMGPPRMGKSSLVASLMNEGCRILDDDVLVVANDRDCPRVLPGYPLFKIWPESAKRFQPLLDTMSLIPTGHSKLVYRVESNFSADPVCLKKIFLLGEKDDASLEPLAPTHASKELLTRWFGLLYRPIFELSGGYPMALRQSAALALKVPVFRMERFMDAAAFLELVGKLKAQPQT